MVSPQLNKFRANLRVSGTGTPGDVTSGSLSQRVNFWKILALNVTLHN